MVTLGTSMEKFASVTELGGKMEPKIQRKTPGTESSSFHEAMVTSSHPQKLGAFEEVVFCTEDMHNRRRTARPTSQPGFSAVGQGHEGLGWGRTLRTASVHREQQFPDHTLTKERCTKCHGPAVVTREDTPWEM